MHALKRICIGSVAFSLLIVCEVHASDDTIGLNGINSAGLKLGLADFLIHTVMLVESWYSVAVGRTVRC